MSWEAEEPALEPHESEPPSKRSRVVSKSAGRYVLKVLCSDELTKCILGAKGKIKDQIQEESGARLMFSPKEDYFPNSFLRVLAIKADDIWCILQALDPVLAKLIECADQEQGNPVPPGLELLGKDDGDYIFRLCLPTKSVSVLIGSGGSNIKQLRAETGVKVTIPNDVLFGHQMVSVIGRPDSIRAGLEKVNEYVQKDASSEAYWEYSQMLGFAEASLNTNSSHRGPAARAPTAVQGDWICGACGDLQFARNVECRKCGAPKSEAGTGEMCGDFKRGICSRGDSCRYFHGDVSGTGSRDSATIRHEPIVVPALIRHEPNTARGVAHSPVVVKPPAAAVVVPPGRSPHGPDTAQSSGNPGVEDQIGQLTEAVYSMPGDTASMQYSMSFPLPDVFRRNGVLPNFRQHLEEMTGASMEDSEDRRSVSLVGPLMGIYAAHLLMMKKAIDVEREEAARSRPTGVANNAAGSVEEMQAKMLELQQKLEATQQALAAERSQGKNSGGKSSGGGKAKGKGKGKSKAKGK